MKRNQDTYGGYAAKMLALTKGSFLRHRFFRRGSVSGVAVIPQCWVGRKSKKGDVPVPAFSRIASVIGVEKSTVANILTGKTWPLPETRASLRAIGIAVGPVYNSDRRHFEYEFQNRCVVCRAKFWANQERRRFCSNACYMTRWHRNVRRRRLCTYCGSKADSRLAWVCKQHEAKRRAASKRANVQARKRYVEGGLCITCGVFAAKDFHSIIKGRRYTSRQKCEPCWSRGRRAWAKWRARQRAELKTPDSNNEMLAALNRLLPAGLPGGVRDDAVGAMALDILEKRLEPDALHGHPETLSAYIKEAYAASGDPYKTVLLSKPLNDDGDTIGQLIASRLPDPAAQVVNDERWEEFAKITGGLTLEKWERMNETDRDWIRTKLAAAGLTPRGVMRQTRAEGKIARERASLKSEASKRKRYAEEQKILKWQSEIEDVRWSSHGRRMTTKIRRKIAKNSYA